MIKPALRLEACPQTGIFSLLLTFSKIKESYDRLTVPTVFHTFKTFFLPITKNLKL